MGTIAVQGTSNKMEQLQEQEQKVTSAEKEQVLLTYLATIWLTALENGFLTSNLSLALKFILISTGLLKLKVERDYVRLKIIQMTLGWHVMCRATQSFRSLFCYPIHYARWWYDLPFNNRFNKARSIMKFAPLTEQERAFTFGPLRWKIWV